MKQYLLAIVCTLFCLVSCNDDPASTSSTGTLNGNTFIYDEKGNPVSDNSGITVSLKEKSISTITNSSGAWLLKDVPMGTYTILFSKPGFDTTKIYGFQFNGYGDVRVEQMSELLKPAPGMITQLSVSIKPASGDTASIVKFNVTPSSDAILTESRFSYVINLSKSNNFSWIQNKDNSIYEFWGGSESGNLMTLEELQEKFGSGSTVYISARLMHRRYGARTDNFNKRYYIGLSAPSETVSLVIP